MSLLPESARGPRPGALALLVLTVLLSAPLLNAAASEPGTSPVVRMDCARRTALGAAMGDQAGFGLAHAGDLDADGHPDLLIGAPQADLAGSASGALYLVRGPIHNAVDLSLVPRITGVNAGDLAGYRITTGNLNGDGHPDFIIGAPYANPGGGAPAGAVYIVYGPVYSSISLASADALIHGAVGDWTGDMVAFVGDVNGDGHGDVLVGVHRRNVNAQFDGAAYLFHGPLHGTRGLNQADAIFVGEAAGDHAGAFVIGAGDVDADGYDDMLVSAPDSDTGGSAAGAVYLVRGSPTRAGTMSLADADAKIVATVPGGYAGMAVRPLGDFDGDGDADLAIGVPDDKTGGTLSGSVHIIDMPTSGVVTLGEATVAVRGATNSQTGRSLDLAGDFDGDGHGDLVVGAWSAGEPGLRTGGAFVFRGGPTFQAPLSLADAIFGVMGIDHGDSVGGTVLGGVDYDEDGEPDIVVAAPVHDGYGLARGLVSIVDRSTALADSDGDRLSDECETQRHLTDPADADTDGDDVTDGAEVLDHGSEPLDPDTDGDLFSDGTEVSAGSDPTDPYSIPPAGMPVTLPVKGPWNPLPLTDAQQPIF